MNNITTTCSEPPKSLQDAKKPSEKNKSVWNRRNITMGVLLTVSICVMGLYYESLQDLLRKPEQDPVSIKRDPPPPFLTNQEFKNKYFPLSQTDMWDDKHGAFAIESQLDKIEQVITNAFYKDHVNWIAKQYDTCTTLAQKFVRDCYEDLYQDRSAKCDHQFSEAQAACSDAKEYGEIFCSQTVQVDELKEVAPQVANMCKEVGLL